MIIELLIVGWLITLGRIGLCALNDAGTLLALHRRIGVWLERLASPKPETLDLTAES
jgi:hypothetical protein